MCVMLAHIKQFGENVRDNRREKKNLGFAYTKMTYTRTYDDTNFFKSYDFCVQQLIIHLK